jgi:hypothetical protein
MLATSMSPNRTPNCYPALGIGETQPLTALRDEPFHHAHPRGLSGDLQYLSLPLLLQALAATDRPATVLFPLRPGVTAPSPLASLGAWAGVAMYDGRFLDARFGEHHGNEALLRLLLVRNAPFETWFDAILWPVQETRGENLEGVLLRAAVRLDELCSPLAELPSLDCPLALCPASFQFTPRSFLLDWPGPFSEGVWALREGLDTGSMVELPPGANLFRKAVS